MPSVRRHFDCARLSRRPEAGDPGDRADTNGSFRRLAEHWPETLRTQGVARPRGYRGTRQPSERAATLSKVETTEPSDTDHRCADSPLGERLAEQFVALAADARTSPSRKPSL